MVYLMEYMIKGKDHPKSPRYIMDPLAIMVAAFGAGYTIGNYPPKFLAFLYSPIGQFIVYYLIVYTFYRNDPTVHKSDMVIEAILYVIVLQCLRLILNFIFK
jgi:hypothetical protein